MPQLFRQQALDQQTDRLHGDILLLPQLSHSLVLGGILIWMGIAAYWLASNTYARKETVQGWLEPVSGVTRVYAKNNGIIKQVLVSDGDKVAKDQPLVIVNGDHILADGSDLESVLLSEYETQRTLLTVQLSRVESIYHRQGQDISQRIAAADESLQLLDDQLITLNKLHNIKTKQVNRLQSLNANNQISAIDMDAAIAQKLELRSEQQSLLRSKVNQRNLIQQLKTEQLLLPDEHANNIDQIQTRLSNIAQEIAQLHGRQTNIIRAPRSGVVTSLQARDGQRAQPTAPILSLVPENSSLTAHLLVPVRSAGFVEVGQQLDIRYDAFPYQKFGLYHGNVSTISEAILLPDELLNAAVPVQEPVYRISAQLLRSTVQAYGKDFPLKPGMTLSADIRLSERSLFQWLLEPIYSLRGRV